MQMQCLFCGHLVQMVHVHGHYQCPVCNTNALPCCDGDNCSTNQLLAENTLKESYTSKKTAHVPNDQN
jgi:Zn finger protein HypA/HybF involved in hydrogenase expression